MSTAHAVYSPPAFVGSPIKENCIGYKILTCIPIVGMFMQIMERSLASKIAAASNVNKKIELLDIKKEYNLCAVIRDVVTLAAAVALVALSIWGMVPLIVLGALCVTGIVLNSYWLHKNLQDLKEFKQHPQPVLEKFSHAEEVTVNSKLKNSPPPLSSPSTYSTNRVLSFASTDSLELSGSSMMSTPKPSYIYNLGVPFDGLTTICLDQIDPFTQTFLFELAEKNASLGLNYYIAVTKDTNGVVSLFDGCSFLRHYFEFDLNENPLNRQKYKRVEYYYLRSLKDKAIERYCSIDDLNNPTSGDMRKKFIGATSTDASSKERVGSDQASVGAAYEMGDPLIKQDVQEAITWYKRAAKNNSFFAYMRLADYAPSKNFSEKLDLLEKARALCEQAFSTSKLQYEKFKSLKEKEKPNSTTYQKLEKSEKYHFETYLDIKLHLGMIYSDMGVVKWKVCGPNKQPAIDFIVESGKYLPSDDFNNLLLRFRPEWQAKILMEYTKIKK